MAPPPYDPDLRPVPADLDAVEPALADLGIERDEVAADLEKRGAGSETALLLAISAGARLDEARSAAVRRSAGEALAEAGTLLLLLHGDRPEPELAGWRNQLWPLFHVGVLYTRTSGMLVRRTFGRRVEIPVDSPAVAGTLLVARRRTHALSPGATVEKFDQNAPGWNGVPGSPGYPHFRWMRRFVGCFAPIPPGARILDFGCGAGWCGIEAARRFRAAELAFFDPSPEMVRIAERNASESGIGSARGRVGFGEAPPFPAEGEPPFDAVISSGVISFSPDPDRWLDGLSGTVAPGGTLVIGDLHRDSTGNRRRRAEKPILPGRELNALTPETVRAGLEARGFRYLSGTGYQLTRPFPEAMHVNETKLGGLFTHPLLWANQLSAATSRRFGLPGPDRFDSWVMRFERDATKTPGRSGRRLDL